MIDRSEIAATVRGIFDRNDICPFASDSLPHGLDKFIAGVLYEKNVTTYGFAYWHTSSFELTTGDHTVTLHVARYDGLGAYGWSQGHLGNGVDSIGTVLGEEDSEWEMMKSILHMIEADLPRLVYKLARGTDARQSAATPS